MRVSHPFEWLSPAAQKRAFVLLFILTLVLMVALDAVDSHLKTAAAPSDIISFEMAGDLPAAQEILTSWGPKGRVYAGLSLGLDYLFLVSYAAAIALGCVLVARGLRRVRALSRAGDILAWVVLVAAVLDATENYGLIQVLLGSRDTLWPVLSRWCAVLKFAIVGVGLAYVVGGALIALGVRAMARE